MHNLLPAGDRLRARGSASHVTNRSRNTMEYMPQKRFRKPHPIQQTRISEQNQPMFLHTKKKSETKGAKNSQASGIPFPEGPQIPVSAKLVQNPHLLPAGQDGPFVHFYEIGTAGCVESAREHGLVAVVLEEGRQDAILYSQVIEDLFFKKEGC